MLRRFLTALILLAPSLAFGQGAVLQGGAQAPGRAPMYVGTGSQAVVGDSGSAAGGGIGVGLSELNITSRAGNGDTTAPYASNGNGQSGAHLCMYDAPITNSTGYHFLCFDPNTQGGAAVVSGAGGGASTIPLNFIVNGSTYSFPFTVSGVLGPSTTVVGHIPLWNNTTGTLLSDGGSSAVLKNGADAVMSLTIDSGLTVAESSRIVFSDRGANKYMTGLQSDGAFTLFSYTTSTNAMSVRAADNAFTFTAPMTIDIGTASGPALVMQTSNDTAWPGLWLKNNAHGVNGQVQIFLARPYAPYGAADLDIWQLAEDIDSSSGWYRPFSIEAVDGNTGVIATPLQATRTGLVGINGVALTGVALAVRGTNLGGVGPILSYGINLDAQVGRYAFGNQTAYIQGETTTNSISTFVSSTRIHTTTSTGYFPATDATFQLGASTLRWADIFSQRGLFSSVVMIGSATSLALAVAELGFQRQVAGNSAPGAAGGKIAFVCGTNAGTLKIIAFAGTSATPVTVTDNIGAAVTGC